MIRMVLNNCYTNYSNLMKILPRHSIVKFTKKTRWLFFSIVLTRSNRNILSSSSNLKILQRETRIGQFWITTRPERKKELEDALGHVSISLNPFTQQDQLEFLVKFWRTFYDNKSAPDVERLDKFAQDLINLLAKSINDREKSFTGIPLKCMMLAEAFRPQWQDDKIVLPTLPEKLPLIELYEGFWKTKLNFLNSKFNITNNNN